VTAPQTDSNSTQLVDGQSRFAETRFAETPFAETLTLTLTLNPNFGESGFGESGRNLVDIFYHIRQVAARVAKNGSDETPILVEQKNILPSNVSKAQINRGWVTLWQNLGRVE